MGDAEIDLAACVGIEVEPGTCLANRERVGACRDSLYLQRLREPGVRHLRRHHAEEVSLETDGVDRAQRAVGHGDQELPAVRAVTEADRRRPRQEGQGAGSCCGCWTSVVFKRRPGPKVCCPAARCQSWPIPSRTVNGASEATVNCRRPSASMTRTRATGAGPRVVPV